MAGKKLPKGISVRKDGQYQARYTLNGKRYTIYGKTQKEVEKKLRDAQYEIEHGIFAKPDRVTVDSWFKVWKEEYAASSMRENTIAHIDSMFRYHIKPEIGHMKMQDVRTEHIQMLLNKMKKQEYSLGFIKRVRNVLSQMFKQAYRNDMIMRNPVENAVTPSGKAKKERRVLTEQEQTLFLKYAKESEYELIFALGFSTGMRIGEIQALQWNNINFKDLEISIEGTLIKVDGKEYRKGPAKTKGSVRTVPLLPDVARYGGDETVIAQNVGGKITLPIMFRGKSLMTTAGKIVWLYRKMIADYPAYRGKIYVNIDDTGLGGGVTDRLEEVKREEKLERMVIVPVNAAARVPDDLVEDGSGKIKACDIYDDMAAYLWGTVKDKLIAEELSLENDNELVAQLSCRKQKMTSRGKLYLESKDEMKKRGIESLDRADAVALSCYEIKTFHIDSLMSALGNL